LEDQEAITEEVTRVNSRWTQENTRLQRQVEDMRHQVSQLGDSLDKARTELRELALDRDSLSDKAKVLTEKKVHNSKSFPEYIH
jgi:hypothetical protein